MIRVSDYSILLYRDFVDFRKSIDGLHSIVNDEIPVDIFQKYLFIFTNKNRDKVKILYWDKTGFALWYKRLEKGRFRWPVKIKEGIFELSGEELGWLLRGIDILRIKPHQELFFKKIQ